MQKYQPSQFEQKWVEDWDKNKIYKAPDFKKKPLEYPRGKQFIFPMFPYPSGAGLHVGHVRVYTGTDVVARFYRMNQYAVLHPMGWDAFGLPAENAAIKAKKNPMDMVPDHIATFKKQMKSLGFSYDWDREFSTTDPSYYRWTQWLFLQFYKMGLLYKKNAPINFCPSCKTGCSEEEVLSNGTHERCGTKIIKKELPQWLFKITSYADRLLEDLKGLDWPRGILEMQKNWIGKDKGLSIDFPIVDSKEKITVWTKFWETVFGTTFLVVAPEFSWLQKLVKQNKVSGEVKKYVEEALSKTDEQRTIQEKDKTGVFTGCYAINPVNNKKVPIWVADYVLATVGTGAVMGVPAHDERDFVFVKKYHLPIIQVVSYKDKKIDEKIRKGEISHEGEGVLVNSGQFDGMSAWGEGKTKMAEWMIEEGFAKWQLHYHLRDWIFSRQRYWGEPIPIIDCKKCGLVPVPESELPVKLPYVKSYEPTGTGESPLAAIKEWVNVACPECGGAARRETDTMPNWAGSCWYFIAFSFWDKGNENCLHSETSVKEWKLKIENYGSQWLPGDWYIGGAEHAVLHLLYARFWVKALYDLKLLNFKEPFTKLRNLGMILAEDHRKMSKSLGNVVNPDDVQKEYGADAIRIYEMFMAPFDQEIAWSTSALQGAYRFMVRVWKIYQQYKTQSSKPKLKAQNQNSKLKTNNNETIKQSNNEDSQLVSKLNKTIKKVTDDILQVKFNTAIAAMMEFINAWEQSIHPKSTASVDFGLSERHAKQFLQILAPFAPFTAEEIWQTVFHSDVSIHRSVWPKVDADSIGVDEEIVIPVQVNGKLRATIKLSTNNLSETAVVNRSLKEERVQKYVEGKKYKVIYVNGKVLNFVLEE